MTRAPSEPVTILIDPDPDPVPVGAGAAVGVVLVWMVVTEPLARVEVRVMADAVAEALPYPEPAAKPLPEAVAADPPEAELDDLTTGQVKSKRGVVLRVVPTRPNCGCFSVSVLASTRVYQ